MSNTILTVSDITRESLRVLHSSLGFVRMINTDYDDRFARTGAKIGTSLQIRLPNQYAVRTGKTLNAQDTTETSVTLTVATQAGIDMNFSTAELTMSLDDFSRRIIQPAVARLAAHIDDDALSMTNNVYNSVGTPGTTPASLQVWGDAGQKLDEYLAPRSMSQRRIVCNPAAMNRTVFGNLTLFNPGDKISDQYRNGTIQDGFGFRWAMDQNVQSLTVGSRTAASDVLIDEGAGTNLVEGTTTLHMDDFTGATDTVKAGEVFTVAGVYAVNPETKEQYGHLQQFVVSANATASSNEVDVTFTPAMYSTGVSQNVSALPVDGAAVTFLGTASTAYPQNLAFHRDAFTLVTADLEMPEGVHFSGREMMDGISIRIVRQYDINNDNIPCRLDVLYGYKAVRPSQAVRVWG